MRPSAKGRPRVVHVVATTNFAGVERYLTYITPELAQRGFDVLVLGGEPLRMHEALAGTGVSHRPASTLPAAMRALLASGRVDIVHAHMTTAEVAAATMKWAVGARLVVTRHFAATRGSSPWGRTAGRIAGRAVDAQIAISEYVAASVEGHSTVLRSGVPDAPAGPHDEPIVLSVQRMEAEKDGAVTIEAWALSGLAEAGWRLVLAGDGADRGRLEHLVHSRGLEGAVDFLGFVADPHDLMARASILIAPASREPLGLSVMEAMARGLAVVAAGGGGHLETAGAAVPASLFEPGNSRAAADLLTALAADAAARKRQGGELRRFQQEALTIGRHVDDLVEIYEGIKRR